MRNYLDLGNYNAVCDSCGRKFKASTMQKRWDGLFVCKEDFEPKHPQLSLKVRSDKQSVPIARPEPVQDTFVPYCDLFSSQSKSGMSVAGCAVAGKLLIGNVV